MKLSPINNKLLKQSEKGNVKQILQLLDMGADVNAKDKEGWTPLLTALGMEHFQAAEILIDAGADVNYPLPISPFDETPLMKAAFDGSLSVVEKLLFKGAEVNAKREDGTTALLFAALGGHLAVVQKLLTAGADIHARSTMKGLQLRMPPEQRSWISSFCWWKPGPTLMLRIQMVTRLCTMLLSGKCTI